MLSRLCGSRVFMLHAREERRFEADVNWLRGKPATQGREIAWRLRELGKQSERWRPRRNEGWQTRRANATQGSTRTWDRHPHS